MKSYKTEGFVLSRKNWGEADRLVTIFTKHFGKRQFIAKGIRRITSKRAPLLELFSYVSIIAHRGKILDVISEVVALSQYPLIRKRLERIGHVYVAVELVLRLTAENQEQENVYELLSHFLATLNNLNIGRSQAKKELIVFKIQLLTYLGFLAASDVLPDIELNRLIENTLESSLKSPLLLTKIQRSL